MRSVSSGRPRVSSSGSMPTPYPSTRLKPGCFSLLGPDLRELDDGRCGEAHVLDADPFALAVRVVTAGEDVRRRQAHLGERGAVGAAADRGLLRLEPDAADSFFEVGDDRRMLRERVAHV